MSRKSIGLLLGFGATLLWASYYPATRFIFGTEADHCDPFLLSLIRFSVSALFFLLLVLFSEKRRQGAFPLLRKEWKYLLFLSFTGVVVQGVLVFIALKFTTAARGSLMANASPIFTVLCAWLFLKEKITLRMLAGMILGFAGIVLAMFSRSTDCFSRPAGNLVFLGDLLALLSGAAWAIYTVGGVRIVKEYDSLTVTMYIFLMGALMMPVIMLLFGSPFDFVLPVRVWLGMVYMGLFTGGTAFCLWLLALKFVNSSELGAFGYLSALLAAFLSIVLLKERFSLLFPLSVVMALGGMRLMMHTAKGSEK